MAPSTSLRANKKILIIEDEVSFIRNLKSVLGQKYEVYSAVSGKEGLKTTKKERPDLILLDLILPDVFGLEVLKKLKADKKTNKTPVIVLTNLGDTQTVSKILEAGGKEYLVKSDYNLNEIVEKVEEVLG